MSETVLSLENLRHLELPSWLVQALLATAIPTFDRFEVGCDANDLQLVDRASGRYLVLGRTDSGAIGVAVANGAVCWLQDSLEGAGGLHVSGYDQFVNSDLVAYSGSVRAYNDVLAINGPDVEALRSRLATLDPASLDAAKEGVWHDVLLDWDAGL